MTFLGIHPPLSLSLDKRERESGTKRGQREHEDGKRRRLVKLKLEIGGGREREIVTINFPLMGVQRRNEVVGRGECRE